MTDAVLFVLPERPGDGSPETDWWHVSDGRVIESGCDERWLQLAAGRGIRRVALAPAAAVRIQGSECAENVASHRQAATVARVAALDSSLGDPESLHAASGPRPGADGQILTAVVDNGAMLAWTQWAARLGADPHSIVPLGALLAPSDQWTRATFGSQALLGRNGSVLPFDAALVAQVTGGADLVEFPEGMVEAALVAATDRPPVELRSGRFARRRRVALDRARIRELASLAAALLLVSLAWSLTSIAKLEQSTDSLESATLAIAESSLGRPANLENVEAELAARAGGRAAGGVIAPLTGLYQALQAEAGVSATQISYRADGTLSATLAAPTLDSISRVMIALQRNNYRITAVTRQATDGRSMVDATVRSAP